MPTTTAAADDEAAAAAAQPPPTTTNDEEGLLLEYDVIVCGTGLVQAILASALARAGKSVLHCDGDDGYGELDAVWPLSWLLKQQQQQQQQVSAPELQVKRASETSTTISQPATIPLSPHGASTSLRFHSFQNQTRLGIRVGTRVQTPYGSGVVQSLPKMTTTNGSTDSCYHSIAVVLDSQQQQWNMMPNGAAPVLYIGIDDDDRTELIRAMGENETDDVHHSLVWEEYLLDKIQSIASLQAQSLFQDERKMRSFALDASPVFVLAAGRAVNGMLASNVADYLEFKTVEGLLWLDNNISNNNDAATPSTSPRPTQLLSRVPCSKNDVFTTKLLSPMDKRRLMKFLQLAMDYATQMSVAEEETRMEHLRNQQVERQQQQQCAAEDDQVQSLNERHLNQGRSLARPQNKAVAKDDLVTLQRCMTETPEMTLDDYLHRHHHLSPKLRSIIRYALAMETSGSSSTTSTSTSISLSRGMSQLRHHLQALGRHGTTAFLVPLYGSGELSQAFCRSAAVFGATYLLRRAPTGIIPLKNTDGDGTIVGGILLSADTMGDGMAGESDSGNKIIRSSTVVVPKNALPCKNAPKQCILRRISVLNGTLVQGEQRHVIFLPPHTIENHPFAIHGVTMDESVQVAPTGCTILHLTTTITSPPPPPPPPLNDDETSSVSTILDRAAKTILQAGDGDGAPVVEVYSVTYSYDLPEAEDEEDDESSHPKGLYVCPPCGQVLIADVAFEQAERIFQKICPGQQFLGLSDKLDAAIQERAAERGYDDEERLMLESALSMIGGGGTVPEPEAMQDEMVVDPVEQEAPDTNELPSGP